MSNATCDPIHLLFTAVLPKRQYKTHTTCIHYHLRDKTHKSHHALIKRVRQTPHFIGVLRFLSAFCFYFHFPQFLGPCSWYVSRFATQILQVTTCSTFDPVTYIFKASILCTFSLLFAVFSQLYSLLWLYLFSMFSLLLFSCIRSRDFSLTRESNSLSDYWRVRLPSLQPRLPYIVLRVPIYLSGCNSLVSAFSLLWIP